MHYTISFFNKAKFELADAVDWYNSQSAGLGNVFAIAIQSKLNTIQFYPKRYPFTKNQYREVSLKKFPFTIIYSIENEDEIVIYSIFHHSRNPEDKFR